MDIALPYTTKYSGELISRGGISPRISIKDKPDESSDVLMWREPTLSTLPEWNYQWMEPSQEDVVWKPWNSLHERLTNPLYGRDILDAQLKEMAMGAPDIEQVWKITESWPSLTKLLLEDRNNE